MSARDVTPPLLLCVVAKERVYAPELLKRGPSMTCARCDRQMVITKDAIGRERRRCPRCDGVSQIKPHPDEALLPQGLVRTHALPAIEAGQLRCQRCAVGVSPSERFCATCLQEHGVRDSAVRAARAHSNRSKARRNSVYSRKPCARCGEAFQPTGPRALFCEGCR